MLDLLETNELPPRRSADRALGLQRDILDRALADSKRFLDESHFAPSVTDSARHASQGFRLRHSLGRS
jgi:hypothetical protein